MTWKSRPSQYVGSLQPDDWTMRRAYLLIGLAFFIATPVRADSGPTPLEVRATPIERFDAAGRTRLGRLEFRGGLVLTSPDPRFGGLSGLLLEGEGDRLIALSDKGNLLTARLVTQGGRLVGLEEARMGPLRAANGRTLAAQGRDDTESLSRSGAGLVVGIERRHEIWVFPGPDPYAATGRKLISFAGFAGLGFNEGIEGLATPADGRPAPLVAVAERDPREGGILPGFLFAPLASPKLIGRFVLDRIDEFNATDLAFGPDGLLYLLERRFDYWRGVALRIRRFDPAQVIDGATLSGEVLMQADRSGAIDNMEGLAVTRGADGEILLTVISDDNFSPLQRTVLLRFALTGDDQ